MRRRGPWRRLELGPCPTAVPARPSPPRARLPGSPEAVCVICLERARDRAYLNNCLHQFCFPCLLQWAEVKPVCPLCQQKFESALHNVRSDNDYDLHVFNVAEVERSPFRDEREPALTAVAEAHSEAHDTDTSYVPTAIIMVDFRRYVYEHRLPAVPLCNTREAACTPQYFRSRPQEARLRLIPWLSRELGVVIGVAQARLAVAIEQVLHASREWHVLSPQFRERAVSFTGSNADLFCWELHNFATSHLSMVQFDDEVRYVVPGHLEVPPHFRQFCAAAGTTNPLLPGLSPASSRSTDSEDDRAGDLHFRTARPRGGGRWSSDGSESSSDHTHLHTAQHRARKLGKRKNSPTFLHRRASEKNHLAVADDSKNIEGDASRNTVQQEPCEAATGSRAGGAGGPAGRTSGEGCSSDDDGADTRLSRYRKRCMYESPVSYYLGGFVPIRRVHGASPVSPDTSCSTSGRGLDPRRRLSSVVVKPATSS
ncbi:uncharacterized protein LOC134530866 isoform X2 [Bacillus rossius redtenbacheri]|uniref:uncharacterized protein LOC134530866 isoform X2 n=1 Tax=Bacillus rossius redtenbacheri TaxID=93214 RepID=UPI002FDE1437